MRSTDKEDKGIEGGKISKILILLVFFRYQYLIFSSQPILISSGNHAHVQGCQEGLQGPGQIYDVIIFKQQKTRKQAVSTQKH